MTVRDLIEELENFDDDMEVVIGMRQRYGCDFAMDIEFDIAEHNVRFYYWEENYKAVVITEGSQCGVVDYDDEEY